MERRLAAIVIADVVGYSKLIHADEEGMRARFQALQEELFGPSVTGHGGRIIKTMGDAFLLEFPSAVKAVACMAKVQRELEVLDADRAKDQRIRFRIGINVGDIIVEDDDIHGDGINIASRLEVLCKPGGVTLSDDAYRQVRDRLDLKWQDGGEHEVKNIARPLQVWHWKPQRSPAEGATASLVLGIISLFIPVVGLGLGIIAIVLGNKARKQPNGGMGTAGFVLGIIGTVLGSIAIIIIAVFVVATAIKSAGGG